jgi:hypothetical protein
MTKTIYGRYHSVYCKVIITEEHLNEAQEARAFLKDCKWEGNLRIAVKPASIYHDNALELMHDIQLFLYIDKEFISLCYDGYEGVDYITEMSDIRNLPDIWAAESFIEALTGKYSHDIIDKQYLSDEDKENLRHLAIMYKLEGSQ